MKLKSLALAVLLMLGIAACQNDENQQPLVQQSSPMDFFIADDLGGSNVRTAAQTLITSEYLDAINDVLEAKGLDYRVAIAEFITAGGSEEAGQTILSKVVGNKQLGHDFVPGDTRREWSGNGGNAITYAIDQTGDAVPPSGGLSAAATTAAIENGTSTWKDVICSDLGLSRNDDFGLDLGYIAAFNGLGGSFAVVADVQHTGFTDINFVRGILGVTFTLVWTDGMGNLTDIDNNGKLDVAFREIYYDPSFLWADSGDPADGIDVESIAVHELGHGLSQAHFGTVAITKKGDLRVSPKAIMNALYTGPYRDLTGTDNAGHCSIWDEWPNN